MDWGEGARSKLAAALAAAAFVVLALASSAGAVVVKLPDGQALGVTPRVGVAPASIPGARRSAARANVIDDGNVDYQGGPVVHSSAPYLILWDPSSVIPAATETLLTRYLADVAHDSGLATNVFAVDRQYSDQTAVANYQETFSPAQVITDTHPYPARDTTSCVDSAPADEATCLTDGQLQSELSRLIAAQGLPTDGAVSAKELVPRAPIYFIVTPPDVNVCAQGPSNGNPAQCADNSFCAYHSSFTDGANHVLYAPIPLLDALVTDPANNLDPKFCQSDNNVAVQEPNGDGGDVALKYLSHENGETITDPLGNGWYDPISGNEIADNCNLWDGGPADVATGDEPSAFEPTLGGSALDGTLYDQLINGDQYYTQSQWSNGDRGCEMRPSASALTASFSAPSGPVASGTAVAFDPAATSSSGGYSSIAWSFGDGTTSFASTATTANPAPTSISHIYTAGGDYTVTLSVVDAHGNVATTSRTVTVNSPPVASFTVSTEHPLVGSAVSFDGTGSSEVNSGATISTYHWSFGDGGTATGATASHTYSSTGAQTATLTVTDSLGMSSSVSKLIDVLKSPVAAFTFSPMPAARGHAIAFDAAGSSDPNAGGEVSSYSWSFGDGARAGGATTAHTYRVPGVYMAQLTITDNFGLSTKVTHSVLVTSPATSSRGSLSGIGKGKPKLTFELREGLHAPGLRRLTITLPSGLSFARKGLAGGVSVKGVRGQKLSFTARLSHGKVTIALHGSTAVIKVTIGTPVLTASRRLVRRVRSGTIKTLTIPVTAFDSVGASTPIRLTPNV